MRTRARVSTYAFCPSERERKIFAIFVYDVTRCNSERSEVKDSSFAFNFYLERYSYDEGVLSYFTIEKFAALLRRFSLGCDLRTDWFLQRAFTHARRASERACARARISLNSISRCIGRSTAHKRDRHRSCFARNVVDDILYSDRRHWIARGKKKIFLLCASF